MDVPKPDVDRRAFSATAGAVTLAAFVPDVNHLLAADDDSDYTVQNGLHVFKKGATPKLPEGYPPADFEVVSRFGFKVVTIKGPDGQDKKLWMAASEQDYRQSEAKRLGKKPDEIEVSPETELSATCYQTGPKTCGGYCTSGFCSLVYNPQGGYYYCTCT